MENVNNLNIFDDKEWDDIEDDVNICLVCQKPIKKHDKTNPLKNTHYDCWVYFPHI